ncbi:reverse transcriptase [Trichonephila clavipes]|nr:reverse transcriptase [Trichonephila clavipes]
MFIFIKYLPETNETGVGWFCRLFEGSLAVGKNATNYDGEVLAVCETTTQLLSAGLAPAKVVFFVDSQAAVLAISNNTPTDCLNTIQCRTKIAELISYDWTVALQWVPSHLFPWTATAGSDVVQSGRPIFDDFFQHLRPYIGNNTANVVFQMVKRLWLIRIDQ